MPDMKPQAEVRPGNPPGHEEDRISLRGIFGFALGLIALTLVVQLVLGVVMGRYARDEARTKAAIPLMLAEPADFRGPHLQGNPAKDRVGVQREQLDRLNSYGWADQKAGIARIPVGRAIDLLIERGLPEVEDQTNAEDAAMKRSPDRPAEKSARPGPEPAGKEKSP